MKNIGLTFLIGFLLIPFTTFSQIDKAQMDKDLRVGAKVLETLWQGEENFVMYKNNVEGNYIQGYGVLFNIGGAYSVFYKPNYPIIIDNSLAGKERAKKEIEKAKAAKEHALEEVAKAKEEMTKANEAEARALAEVNEAKANAKANMGDVAAQERIKDAEERVKVARDIARVAEERAKVAQAVSNNTIAILENDDKPSNKNDLENIMIEFLFNYSQLIGQLKPTDKIAISTKKSDYVYVVSDKAGQVNESANGIIVEVLKKDHADYVSGKISRDELISRITINKEDGEALKYRDLDLFSAMIKTLYDKNYSDSYFVTWKPDYQRLNGVGAIYDLKVYSSIEEDGSFAMPGINKHGLSAEERNKKVVELYPIFIKSMKENIIQYGRTINSLQPNELLIIKVTLTKCDNCSIPQKIQFAIKQSILASYNSGKLSQKEAIAKVKLSEF